MVHHTDILEERIRELCHQALTMPDAESEPIFQELNLLVHQHVNNLRYFTVAVQEDEKHAA